MAERIMRLWQGHVRTPRAADYLELMRSVAIPDYRSVQGNLGPTLSSVKMAPSRAS